MSLLHPRACIHLFGVLKSFRLSYSNDMTPTFIGTQQQPWSLWRTNTSLTPCHQGAFFHTGFPRDSNPQAYPRESLRAAMCSSLYRRQTTNSMYAWSVMCAMIQWITVSEISSSHSWKCLSNSR